MDSYLVAFLVVLAIVEISALQATNFFHENGNEGVTEPGLYTTALIIGLALIVFFMVTPFMVAVARYEEKRGFSTGMHRGKEKNERLHRDAFGNVRELFSNT